MKQLLAYLDTPSQARRVLAVYWVLLAISTHVPDPQLGGESNLFAIFQIDKAIHFVAFGGLAYLLVCARLAGARSSLCANALVAVVIAGAYALVDEYTQWWGGRTISSADVVAGLIGIVTIFLITTVPPARQRATRRIKAVRFAACVALILVFVMALAPAGNQWFNWMARPLFIPWPGIDKTGHFYTSAALTLLLAAAAPAGVHRPAAGIFLTILVIGLSGPIIETGQSLTGRSVEMADLYAHQVGLLAAMLAMMVFPVGRAARMRLRDRSHPDA